MKEPGRLFPPELRFVEEHGKKCLRLQKANIVVRRVFPMDVLRQAYPLVDDIYLNIALNDADGDVDDALEMLLLNIGERNTGKQI